MPSLKVCNGFRFPIGFRETFYFFKAGQFREVARIWHRFESRLRRWSWGCFQSRVHHFFRAIALKALEFADRVQGGGVAGGFFEFAQFLVFCGLDLVLFVLFHNMVHPVIHAGILA